ncbi:hypothetical protein HME9304_01784 [Flagellimonas maritima]|uniref:HTH cro/C1-type domain-containing protein n=1 Tax=Flagellimonas maritima TaxID=1383885 RepID=A0A2Z4LSS8_9FLAO|nr:hypothetical protein HME9304_01784 [Allomuricauda aurantiaca]
MITLEKSNSLKKYREILGLSQIQISEELKLSQATISRIERGKLYGKGFVRYIKYLVGKNFDMNEYFRNWGN